MKFLINLGDDDPGQATDSHNAARGLGIGRCVGGAEEQRRSKS